MTKPVHGQYSRVMADFYILSNELPHYAGHVVLCGKLNILRKMGKRFSQTGRQRITRYQMFLCFL